MSNQRMILLRVTEKERQEFEREADRRGISVSELIRKLLVEARDIPDRQ